MTAKRQYTAPYLSDMLPDRPKLFVECPTCGMKKRYDVAAMLEKIEDTCLPELLRVIAKAEGCEKAKKDDFRDQCHLRYAGVSILDRT